MKHKARRPMSRDDKPLSSRRKCNKSEASATAPWDYPVLKMSNLQQQRKIVEQLRREAGLKRMEVSAAVEDLKKYIQDHESDDYLLVGFHSQKANPFREKSSCSLL